MARIKSAKKRALIAERNRLRNVACKSAIKTAIKKALTPPTGTDRQQAISAAYGVIDRAVLKGIIHKNTAARYKSRITRPVA